MEKLYRTNEVPLYQDNRSVNYYITGKEVIEKMNKIGDRTQKAIGLVGSAIQYEGQEDEGA